MDWRGLARRFARKRKSRSASLPRSKPAGVAADLPDVTKTPVSPPASLQSEIGASAGPADLFNRDEIAIMWKVAPQTVDGWLRELKLEFGLEGGADCPVVGWGGRGRSYEIDAQKLKDWLEEKDAERQAYEEEKRKAIRAKIIELDLEDTEADAAVTAKERKEHYEAEKVRIAVDLQRQNLLRRDQVEATYADLVRFLRGELSRWPDELERKLGLEPVVTDAIEQAVRGLQNELAKKLMRIEPRDLEDRELPLS